MMSVPAENQVKQIESRGVAKQAGGPYSPSNDLRFLFVLGAIRQIGNGKGNGRYGGKNGGKA